MERVRIRADVERADGAPAFEIVDVDRLGPNTYRLHASPGLALDLAAGDVFEVDSDGITRVVTRGGNVCVQIYLYEGAELSSVEEAARSAFEPLGGLVDGLAAREVVVTVPVTAGFEAIEVRLDSLQAAEEFCTRQQDETPGSEWVIRDTATRAVVKSLYSR